MGTITRGFANLITANGPSELPSGVGGSWIKLSETVVTSNVSAVDFGSSVITSTYKVYKVICTNVQVDTDNTTFGMRFSSDGGSTFITASDYDRMMFASRSSDTDGTVTSRYGAYNYFPLNNGVGVGNVANEEEVHCEITIYNPSATKWKTVSIQGGFADANNDRRQVLGSYYFRNNNAINGIRLFNASGNNIAGGVFTVYGVAN